MHRFWQAIVRFSARVSRYTRHLHLRAVSVGVSMGLLYVPSRALGADGPCPTLDLPCYVGHAGKAAFSSIIGTVVLGFSVLVRLFAEFCALIISLTQPLFTIFIEGSNYITKNQQIADIWKIFRDLANALLIIVLLIGAVMVIMQRANYTVKAILPKLALAVLLVNFSKMMIQLMLDAFHVVSSGIYQFASPTGEINELNAVSMMIKMLRVDDIINTIATSSEATGSTLKNGELFIGTLFVAALVVYICFSVVSLLILYVERYFGLAILLMFSPLALILGILPISAFKTLHDSFWKKLVNYASMSVIVSAHLALASIISQSFLATDITKIEQAPNAGKLTTFPGGPDIDWTTLVNVILIGVIVKAAVNAAKNDKLGFATAAVDTIQKKGQEWAQKTVTEPLKRMPIFPTIERGEDGKFRPTLTSAKRIGGAIKDVTKNVTERMESSEKAKQQRTSESVMRLGEKLRVPFTDKRLVTAGTADKMAADARAEREKPVAEKIKNVSDLRELRSVIAEIEQDPTSDDNMTKLRLLLEHKQDLIGKLNANDSNRIAVAVTSVDAALESRKTDVNATNDRRQIARHIGAIGKLNAHLAFDTNKVPDDPNEGTLVTAGRVAPISAADSRERIQVDYITKIQEAKNWQAVMGMIQDPDDRLAVARGRLFTPEQIQQIANRGVDFENDYPELMNELILNHSITVIPGPPRYFVPSPTYTQDTSHRNSLT